MMASNGDWHYVPQPLPTILTEPTTTTCNHQVTGPTHADLIFTAAQFYMIHITGGVVPLTLSLVLCTRTVVLLLCFNIKGSFYKLGIGERLTLYLAACDFVYSLVDLSQHMYILAVGRTLPASACSLIGELLTLTLSHPNQLSSMWIFHKFPVQVSWKFME